MNAAEAKSVPRFESLGVTFESFEAYALALGKALRGDAWLTFRQDLGLTGVPLPID